MKYILLCFLISAEANLSLVNTIVNPYPCYSLVNSVDFHPKENLFCATYTHGNQVVLYKLDGEGTSSIIQSLDNPSACFSEPQHAVFSPDGETIMYSSRKRLMLRIIKTGADKIMVDDDKVKELPKWSPDGKWVTYQASTGGANATYDIYKAEVSTGKVTKLTDNQGLDANPSFDKTGKKIIYVTTPEGVTPGNRLCIMDADGSNKKIDPTSPPNCWLPVF